MEVVTLLGTIVDNDCVSYMNQFFPDLWELYLVFPEIVPEFIRVTGTFGKRPRTFY